ncbi:MAG: tetratricopeptide repeat protein [Bacteroidetes bacterium]|nr:tetratricopeptide repeat protein [Bacteroidota bacterium]
MNLLQVRTKNLLLSILFLLCHFIALSQSKEAWNERARQNLDAKNYVGAIENYTDLLKIYPNDSIAYFDRAMVKHLAKDYLGAVADFTTAIGMDSSSPDNYYLRGIAQCKLKNYTEAISDFDKSLSLEPENADVHYFKGLANAALHQYNQAIAENELAIKLGTDRVSESFRNSALANAKMHQYKSAKEVCKKSREYKQEQKIKTNNSTAPCWCHLRPQRKSFD